MKSLDVRETSYMLQVTSLLVLFYILHLLNNTDTLGYVQCDLK